MEIENEELPHASGEGPPQPPSHFKCLPARVLPAEWVEEVDAEPAKDPDFGRDPNNEALYG